MVCCFRKPWRHAGWTRDDYALCWKFWSLWCSVVGRRCSSLPLNRLGQRRSWQRSRASSLRAWAEVPWRLLDLVPVYDDPWAHAYVECSIRESHEGLRASGCHLSGEAQRWQSLGHLPSVRSDLRRPRPVWVATDAVQLAVTTKSLCNSVVLADRWLLLLRTEDLARRIGLGTSAARQGSLLRALSLGHQVDPGINSAILGSHVGGVVAVVAVQEAPRRRDVLPGCLRGLDDCMFFVCCVLVDEAQRTLSRALPPLRSCFGRSGIVEPTGHRVLLDVVAVLGASGPPGPRGAVRAPELSHSVTKCSSWRSLSGASLYLVDLADGFSLLDPHQALKRVVRSQRGLVHFACTCIPRSARVRVPSEEAWSARPTWLQRVIATSRATQSRRC